MLDFVISLSFLGYCLSLRKFVRWPVEATPFFIVSAIIILFYFAAYLGVLQTTGAVTVLFGGLLFLLSPVYLWADREQLFKNYFTPGFVFFIAFLIVFGIAAQHLMIIGWDELTRWALHGRAVSLYHGLWHSNDYAVGDKEFPPANALFYYFFTQWGAYSDGRFHFAHLFLVFSPIVILLRKYPWSDWPTAFIFYVTILIVLVYGFQLQLPPVGSIMLDRPAGLFFGGILASYFILKQERALWFYLCLPAMALVLFKPMLYPFVAVAGIIILCDQALLIRKKREGFLSLLLFTAILFLPLIVYASWQYYLKQLGILPEWSISHLLNFLHNGSSPFDRSYVESVMPNYKEALKIPFLFADIMVIWSGWLYFRITDSFTRNRVMLTQAWLFAGYIAFVVLLLLVYLYLMPPSGAASDMSSFDRFMVIYYIGWFFTTATQTFYLLDRPFIVFPVANQLKYLTVVILSVLIVVCFGTYYRNHHVKDFAAKKNWIYIRYEMQRLAVPTRQLTEANASVGMMWIGKAKMHTMQKMLAYELFPRFVPITIIDHEKYATQGEFVSQVRQYHYLFLGYVNPTFWQHYGHYFNDAGHPKPLTTMTLCTDAKFYSINDKGCVPQQAPVFLYKVTFKNGELRLMNRA